MQNLLAKEVNLGTGSLNGIGPLGNPSDPFNSLNMVISAAVGLITVIAGIWFIFLLITGAIGVMSAGADKAALEDARKKLLTGLIGLTVVIAGIFLIDFIGGLLGLNILNPGEVISNLSL